MARHTDRLRERALHAPSWHFKSLTWGLSSGFPLANHLALPESESVFGSLRVRPFVHMHLVAKLDPSEVAYE